MADRIRLGDMGYYDSVEQDVFPKNLLKAEEIFPPILSKYGVQNKEDKTKTQQLGGHLI